MSVTITIGFRSTPKEVSFAIYDADEGRVLNIETLRIPIAFDEPQALKFVRSNVLDILREYSVEFAGIRLTEPSAQSFDLRRIHIEGVIQEAFASSVLRGFYAGPIAVISRRLGIDRKQFKPAVAGENVLQIDNWDGMAANQREAIMTAIGAARV
ncbi:hypothetical protein [Qipengyuania mesophila]|uniref:hypothetical protein n=1 Tax=Qipengyuania mesophila TaxID=2867246 RepID=UPI00351800FD